MNSEEWRPAPGFDDRYEVSNHGRVRHVASDRARKLKVDPRGYVFVGIAIRRRSENIHVARLVCHAFNGPPPPNHEVDHKNKDRGDNRSENLRWVTRQENLAHRTVHTGEANSQSKLTADAVRKIRASSAPSSILASAFGVSPRTIRDARNHNTWRDR